MAIPSLNGPQLSTLHDIEAMHFASEKLTEAVSKNI